MEDNPNLPPHPQDNHRDELRPSPPRRFVYRSAETDTNLSHPLRRSTDMPRPFQGIPGQLIPRPTLLKFRVYLKVN